jgi:hypothetical protein
MKLHILILGGLLCLGATAQTQSTTPQKQNQNKDTQSADRMKSVAAGQSVTGCVDQQNGHYVLRDVQSDRLIVLKPTGANADDDFARFVGHQAQASGTMDSGTMTVTHIGQVADMCPIGK